MPCVQAVEVRWEKFIWRCNPIGFTASGRYGLFPAELGRERHPLVDPEVKLPERPARGVPVARRRLGDVVARDLDDLRSGLGRQAVGERHVEAEHCLLRRDSDVLDDLAIVNTADAQLIPRLRRVGVIQVIRFASKGLSWYELPGQRILVELRREWVHVPESGSLGTRVGDQAKGDRNRDDYACAHGSLCRILE